MILLIILLLPIQASDKSEYLQGCKDYGKYETGCNECYFGYSLKTMEASNLQFCQSCPAGCIKCDDNSNCQYCFEPYFLTNENQCQRCNPSCLTCNSENSCIACSDGYFFESLNTLCEKCVDNCLRCSTRYKCDECFEGFPISEDGFRCINFNANSARFWIVYLATSLLGVIIMMLFLCFTSCEDSCCGERKEDDSIDLRHSFVQAAQGNLRSVKQSNSLKRKRSFEVEANPEVVEYDFFEDSN